MEEKQFIRHLPRASVLTLKDQISYQEGQIASKTLAQHLCPARCHLDRDRLERQCGG